MKCSYNKHTQSMFSTVKKDVFKLHNNIDTVERHKLLLFVQFSYLST